MISDLPLHTNTPLQVVADTSPFPHGSPTTINTILDPLPHGSPVYLLAVGVVGGKADDQEDVSRGLVGGQEKPIEPFSTSHFHPNTSKVVNLNQNGQPQNGSSDSTVPTKKAKPNAQKRKAAQKKKAELEDAPIGSHHDKDSPQNFGKEITRNVPTSDVQTPGKRKVTPEIQEDIDEADHFIYDHPHEATRVQNNSDNQIPNRLHSIIEREEVPEEVDHFIYDQTQQTHTPDPRTPIENPTPIACDPPDPIFVVCNLNISGNRDFEADEYRQAISEDEIDYDSEEEPKNTTDDAHAMQLL
ncbi:hypothetical protein HAX54_023919 [Datura stramonium]|uniref:Uncharacterized protein n=1 Tax=Datura stramonium TaxID=4076 RepID=A0ABS8UZB0_DATST|nr:hypothetical protein [Datura stramonium]